MFNAQPLTQWSCCRLHVEYRTWRWRWHSPQCDIVHSVTSLLGHHAYRKIIRCCIQLKLVRNIEIQIFHENTMSLKSSNITPHFNRQWCKNIIRSVLYAQCGSNRVSCADVTHIALCVGRKQLLSKGQGPMTVILLYCANDTALSFAVSLTCLEHESTGGTCQVHCSFHSCSESNWMPD